MERRTTVVVPVGKGGLGLVGGVAEELTQSGWCEAVLDVHGVEGLEGVPVVREVVHQEPFELPNRLRLAADLLDAAQAVPGDRLLVLAPALSSHPAWLHHGVISDLADELVLCVSSREGAVADRLALPLVRSARGAVVVVDDEPAGRLELKTAATAVLDVEDLTPLPFVLGEEAGDSLALDHPSPGAFTARHRVLEQRWLAFGPGPFGSRELLHLLEDVAALLESRPDEVPTADIVGHLLVRLPGDLDRTERDRLHGIAVRLTRLRHPAAASAVELLR